MMNDRLDKIIRLENEYRSLRRQATNLHNIKGKATNEECTILQEAASIKSEIIQLTANPGGSEAEQRANMRELDELNHLIQQIRKELNPVPPKKADKKGDAPANTESNKTNAEDDIPTDSWYKDMPKHSFDNVSGMESVKQKLRDCMIDAELKRLAERLKIKLLNSFFFVGPPGCGKTYIIEAFIHELMEKEQYNYISLNGADIISKYVGDAEKIVEKLFDEAIEKAPCVVFIDEIDGVCKNRSLQALPEYAASITTSFLSGYNNINSSNSKIIFIGATNYPKKVDAAMLDRVEVISVGLPDTQARENAFHMNFNDLVALDSDLTYAYMAEKTEGCNYRDIDRIVSNIKKMIFKEFADELKSNTNQSVDALVDSAIRNLDSGSYVLTKAKFDAILDAFTPSNKNDIIQDIEEWMAEIQKKNDGE